MQREIEIIKNITNIKEKNRIIADNIGWTSRAYLIDNGKMVFKFPRNENEKKMLHRK